MKFSYNWLKQYLPNLPKPEKLAQVLTLKSFNIEDIEKKAKDHILNVELLPNRIPDCGSHLGLAREIGAIFNLKIKEPNIKISESNKKVSDQLEVKIEDPELCSRYTARIINDIKVGPSPKWLKEQLEILGLKSINNVVDSTNFVMLEYGQPLHAFSLEKLESSSNKKKIIIRPAKKGEKIKSLDEAQTEYVLCPDNLVISDEKKPIAIAGIKGGFNTAIDNNTTSIIIESANFDKVSISKTSKKMNLVTDASLRFSAGLDPNLTIEALDRAASLIIETCKGKSAKGIIDVYPRKNNSARIAVRKKYLNDLIGIEIPNKKTKEIFDALGFECKEEKEKFIITVPTIRTDIEREEDLIEEVARIYGYEQIQSKAPEVNIYTDTYTQKEKQTEIWDTIEAMNFRNLVKDILSSLTLNEVYGYSFIGEQQKQVLGLNNLLELQNPNSYQFQCLRSNLLAGLLENTKNNLKNYPEVRLFETGRVFKKDPEKGIVELRRVAGVIAADKQRKLFFELKGLIDSFLDKLGITDYFYDDTQPFFWPKEDIEIFHPGAFAEIKMSDKTFGIIGEINPAILYDLDPSVNNAFKNSKVVAFEFDLEKLFKELREEREYQPISKYPAIIRDISILLDQEIRTNRILELIQKSDSKGIVQDVEIFDIYEDETLSHGKKSVTFHIIYQSNDHTLNDKEVDEIEDKIKANLKTELKAETR